MKHLFGSSQQQQQQQQGNGQKKERSMSDITILSTSNDYDTSLNGNSARQDINSFSLTSSSNQNNTNSMAQSNDAVNNSNDINDHYSNIQRPASSQSQGNSNYYETGSRANGNTSQRSSRLSSGFGVFLRYAAPFIGADGVPGAPVRKPKKSKFPTERIMSRLSSMRLSYNNSSSQNRSASSSRRNSAQDESLNGIDIVDGIVKIEEVDMGIPNSIFASTESRGATSASQSPLKTRNSWSITSFLGNIFGFSSSSNNQKSERSNSFANTALSNPRSSRSSKAKKDLSDRPGSPESPNFFSSSSNYSSPNGSLRGRDKRTNTISSLDDEIENNQFLHQQLHSILLLPEAIKEMNKKGSKASFSTYNDGEGEVIESRLKDRVSAKIIVAIAAAAEYLAEKGTEIELNVPRDKSSSPTPKASSLSARLFGRSPKINEKNQRQNSYPQTPPHPVLSSNFAGVKKPKIPLDRYLTRIVRYLNTFHEQHPSVDSVGTRCLIIATHFIDRLRLKYSDPLSGSTSFQLNQMNVHRLFLVACLLAAKITEDDHPTNEYMANVGGVELKELDTLESHFCNAMEFDFRLNPLEIQELYNLYNPDQTHVLKEPTGDGPP